MNEFYTFEHNGKYNINEDCVYMDAEKKENVDNDAFVQLSAKCAVINDVNVAVVDNACFNFVKKIDELIGYILDSKTIQCNNFLNTNTATIMKRQFFLSDKDCGKYSNGTKVSFNVDDGHIVNVKALNVVNGNIGTNMVGNVNGLLNDLYVNIIKNNIANPKIPIPSKKYDITMQMDIQQQICLYYNILNFMDKITYLNKGKTNNGNLNTNITYNNNNNNINPKYNLTPSAPYGSNFANKNNNNNNDFKPMMYGNNNMNSNIYKNNNSIHNMDNNLYKNNINNNNNNIYNNNNNNNNNDGQQPIMHLNIHQHSTNNINHIMNLNITNNQNSVPVTTKEKVSTIKQSKYSGQHPRTLLQHHAQSKGLETPTQPTKKPYHDGSWIATSSYMGVHGVGRAINSKDAIFMAYHNIYLSLQIQGRL